MSLGCPRHHSRGSDSARQQPGRIGNDMASGEPASSADEPNGSGTADARVGPHGLPNGSGFDSLCPATCLALS